MSFFQRTGEELRVRVRVTPKASRTAITGLVDIPGGKQALKISVTAAPEAGKANAAVVALLARAWDIPKSAVDIVAGETDRNKVLSVTGNPTYLSRAETWLTGRHERADS